MLFITNLVAILIVWTIFFWLYWFTPHLEKHQKNMYKWLSFVVFSIIIITIPLVSSFLQIREEITLKKDIQNYLETNIWLYIDSFDIQDVDIKGIKKDKIYVESVIKLPENVDLDPVLEKINGELSSKYWKTVEVDLEVIRVVKIVSEN